jgi:hypothetical protein
MTADETRNADGLRLNRQLWATSVRDKNIGDLRQLIIDAGAALSKADTESHSLKTDTPAGMMTPIDDPRRP